MFARFFVYIGNNKEIIRLFLIFRIIRELPVPSIVRSIPQTDILLLRQQTQFLWNTYFSSMEKIVQTTLEILKERVEPQLARSPFVWNNQPGALVVLPEYSQDLTSLPFFWSQMAVTPPSRFTAVVYASGMSVMTSQHNFPNTPLFRLIKSLTKSACLEKIVILWHCDTSPPPNLRWPSEVPVVLKIIHSVNERFYAWDEIETTAVLCVDEDTIINTDEVDFAFHVWTYFPERLVGYAARSHYWDDAGSRWGYTSKTTNAYSMMLMAATFVHRYYFYLYAQQAGKSLLETVDKQSNCEDILMNFLVSHVTKYPPIKLAQRRTIRESESPTQSSDKPAWPPPNRFAEKQGCLNQFVEYYGYMPLLRSNLRLDPLLYKDPVSILRKKYRKMELV